MLLVLPVDVGQTLFKDADALIDLDGERVGKPDRIERFFQVVARGADLRGAQRDEERDESEAQGEEGALQPDVSRGVLAPIVESIRHRRESDANLRKDHGHCGKTRGGHASTPAFGHNLHRVHKLRSEIRC